MGHLWASALKDRLDLARFRLHLSWIAGLILPVADTWDCPTAALGGELFYLNPRFACFVSDHTRLGPPA